MDYFIGNDDFSERFDFYKWSAPFLETPQEVVRYVDSLHLYGKILTQINVIGCGYDIGHTNSGLLYQKIREAGIEPDNNWYHSYPHLGKIMLPWSVSLCEPIQFVFEDGNTLEILPTESGGARIGINSVPQTISDGLNRSNFNANIFFEEVVGRSFESFSMCTIETNNLFCWTLICKSNLSHLIMQKVAFRSINSGRRFFAVCGHLCGQNLSRNFNCP